MVMGKGYGRFSKSLNTTCLSKTRTNSAEPDQTASGRSSLIMVLPVCFSDNNFVNLSPDSQHFV